MRTSRRAQPWSWEVTQDHFGRLSILEYGSTQTTLAAVTIGFERFSGPVISQNGCCGDEILNSAPSPFVFNVTPAPLYLRARELPEGFRNVGH